MRSKGPGERWAQGTDPVMDALRFVGSAIERIVTFFEDHCAEAHATAVANLAPKRFARRTTDKQGEEGKDGKKGKTDEKKKPEGTGEPEGSGGAAPA